MDAEDDLATWHQWYPLGTAEDFVRRGHFQTKLLERFLTVEARSPDRVTVRHENGTALPAHHHLGYVWTTLGEPKHNLFEVSEYDESDRLIFNIWSTPLRCCGLRIIENVMDNAHFMYVHPGILGDREHPDLPPYENEVDAAGDLWSYAHKAYLPIIGDVATYTYRVPSPYAVILYIHRPLAEGQAQRYDVLGIFAQPLDEESFVAHKFFCWVKEDYMTVTGIRSDQQWISVQDKYVLENHSPKKLALTSGAEHSVPIDSASDAYRSWLLEKGVRYGTVTGVAEASSR